MNNNKSVTYQTLTTEISKIKDFFDVEKMELPGSEYDIFKFIKIFSPNYPMLIIMAGCHGEEMAPTISIFKSYKLFFKLAKKHRVNLIIYPLVNPWGFDRNCRYNRLGLCCNSNWIHKKDRQIAQEVKTIANDIVQYRPTVFASIHEDDETENAFYLYSFGDRKYEGPLLNVGTKFFPVLPCGDRDEAVISDGVVYDHHDGSAEDFMSHHGCQFSCCTETPLFQPLSKRIECNTKLVAKLIELTGELK